MPFCCIAMAGLAVLYYFFLITRQLVSGPWRDPASPLRVPPRAITGNYAQPVWGHTPLFKRHGGDIALLFPPDWREWLWIPWSRQIGECFSIFIWGQWRVVIKGPERTQQILDLPDVQQDWAWSAPVTLLGKSCLVQGQEEDFLRSMLMMPLGQDNVIRHAPRFAEIAEGLVDDLLSGKFQHAKGGPDGDDLCDEESSDCQEGRGRSIQHGDGSRDESKSLGETFQVKWELLRNYTLDLIDGPVLAMNKWTKESEQAKGETTAQKSEETDESTESEVDEHAKKLARHRRKMLKWMYRLKKALCVIRITFGPEWMYIWLCSAYGRAIIARKHLVKHIRRHVRERAEQVEVHHAPGHAVYDPLATTFPIITMAEQVWRRNYNVIGETGVPRMRPRSRSENFALNYNGYSGDCEDILTAMASNPEPWEVPFEEGAEEEEAKIEEEPREYLVPLKDPDTRTDKEITNRRRTMSTPAVFAGTGTTVVNEGPTSKIDKEDDNPPSILDDILLQHDVNGNGLTENVTTELCILIWMMMDAGNAWTAMALNLLSLDQSACHRVQQELDHLVSIHGKEKLFAPKVLRQMTALDALIYEAIRLCPAFLGGMKTLGQTTELQDDGVQIPKNAHIIFCKPTEENFNMSMAMGKKPEDLGDIHPCCELHGFLAFKGLEVPLMVLQSKVFIAVLLQRCTPFLSKKRTLIRIAKEVLPALSKSRAEGENAAKEDDVDDEDLFSSLHGEVSFSEDDHQSKKTVSESMVSLDRTSKETTKTEAMRLFTKIPFPEPKRVINIRERDSALDILGVSGLANVV